MNRQQIDEMTSAIAGQLEERKPSGAIWRGHLSSSAISTSVAMFALYRTDSRKYASYVDAAAAWLISTMKEEGSWGDTLESPSNMTATLLSFTALYAVGKAPDQAKAYLTSRLGGIDDDHLVKGVLDYYGTDLTFSVPILVMCAMAGIVKDWNRIPNFPFELTILPQRFFRFLRLPVVSYAIPALIAVGILRFRKGRKGPLASLRESFVPRCLEVLTGLQPDNGGFLEAAPLTGFVAMCMSAAGMADHVVTLRATDFLTATVRDDGSWPIDTDLACWVTSLSSKVLADGMNEGQKHELSALIRKSAFTFKHYFTGAQPGGWGWSDLPGAVPDADDTSGALVALHRVSDGKYCPEAGKGIEWLIALQNSDGGMPTFCKGWGKLPFDRSCADISAHALLAYGLWMPSLPDDLKVKCRKSALRMLKWMKSNQAADGSWTPLWFGDQDAPDEKNPVYGTATTVEYLSFSDSSLAAPMMEKGVAYLLSAQNPDGGWGGAPGVKSKVTMTAKAVAALAAAGHADGEAVAKGFDYLYDVWQAGDICRPEPIGLYFSRLWYSEDMYNLTFTLNALNALKFKIS